MLSEDLVITIISQSDFAVLSLQFSVSFPTSSKDSTLLNFLLICSPKTHICELFSIYLAYLLLPYITAGSNAKRHYCERENAPTK